MELHKNTTNAFINYLKLHGYPEDSIVTEWGDSRYQIDIAILDKARAIPVAIYEVKGNKTNHSISLGLNQLKRFIKFLGYPVEAGLVFSKTGRPYFEFVNLSGKLDDIQLNNARIEEFVSGTEPLSYENLKNSAEPKMRNRIKKKKERKLNTFNAFSWALALMTFVILVFECFNVITFTTERIIVFGVVILLTILPFYSEMKFGDLSLKRESKNQSKD